MGTTAEKLQAILNSKEAIRLAIVDKGVSVPEETILSQYPTKISEISAGAAPEWTAPADWIQLEEPADNEILLLVGDEGVGDTAFTITCVGGYTVNWGDGVTESFASGVKAEHVYPFESGQLCNRGYSTFKIRIYAQVPANPITRYIANYISPYRNSASVLWIKFGTTGLTTLENAFNLSYAKPLSLESVSLPNELPNCTNYNSTFSGCKSLKQVIMPSVYSSSLVSMNYTFLDCSLLPSIDFNTASANISSAIQLFQGCTSLRDIIFPTAINGLTTIERAFTTTTSLKNLKLPIINTDIACIWMFNGSAVETIEFDSSWNNRIFSSGSMFYNTTNIRRLINFPLSFKSYAGGMFSGLRHITEFRFPDVIEPYTYSLGSVLLNCNNLINLDNFPPFPNVTDVNYTFRDCVMLKSISNLDQLGDTTTNMDLSFTYQGCRSLEEIVCRNKVTTFFVLNGTAAVPAKLRSLLFTNPNPVSTWAGHSTAVSIQYCNMDATALNAMFTSIVATSAPGALSGKTISIFGNPGAATCDTTIITNEGGAVAI